MMDLLHYEAAGSGLPVVLLHPTPVDHHFWMPAAVSLQPGYRVLMPDLPGHGLSSLGEEPTSMASMAVAVLRLLDALAVEQAIFCGCSIGGYVLYELWRQAPQRVRAMAICCAKPHPDTPEARRQREITIAAIQDRSM